MTARSYRLWAAITHEVLRLLCDDRPSLRYNQIVRALSEQTRGDWIEWKTEHNLRDVDLQIAALHQQWDKETATAPIITDDGIELRIRAPWIEPAPYARDTDELPASHPPA